MNFIYITTNSINGKQYIGSHNGDINDNYLGSGKVLLKSIKKYGSENFKREILEECDPSLNVLLETKYIKKYNTIIPNGYNISPTGGRGVNGWYKHSDETKEKIRKSLIGKNKGNKHTEETKERIRQYRLGKSASEETKKKLRTPMSEEAKKKLSES